MADSSYHYLISNHKVPGQLRKDREEELGLCSMIFLKIYLISQIAHTCYSSKYRKYYKVGCEKPPTPLFYLPSPNNQCIVKKISVRQFYSIIQEHMRIATLHFFKHQRLIPISLLFYLHKKLACVI